MTMPERANYTEDPFGGERFATSGTGSTKPPQRQVERELEALGKMLECLFTDINCLAERIKPILRPEQKEGNGAGSGSLDREMIAPLADSVRSLSDVVGKLRSRVVAVTQRVEL